MQTHKTKTSLAIFEAYFKSCPDAQSSSSSIRTVDSPPENNTDLNPSNEFFLDQVDSATPQSRYLSFDDFMKHSKIATQKILISNSVKKQESIRALRGQAVLKEQVLARRKHAVLVIQTVHRKLIQVEAVRAETARKLSTRRITLMNSIHTGQKAKEALQLWKAVVTQEKIRYFEMFLEYSANLIQKHWRGHIARKEHSTALLSRIHSFCERVDLIEDTQPDLISLLNHDSPTPNENPISPRDTKEDSEEAPIRPLKEDFESIAAACAQAPAPLVPQHKVFTFLKKRSSTKYDPLKQLELKLREINIQNPPTSSPIPDFRPFLRRKSRTVKPVKVQWKVRSKIDCWFASTPEKSPLTTRPAPSLSSIQVLEKSFRSLLLIHTVPSTYFLLRSSTSQSVIPTLCADSLFLQVYSVGRFPCLLSSLQVDYFSLRTN